MYAHAIINTMIRITTLVGKGVQRAARLRGGGSALPGLVVEKLDRHFLARTLDALPHGVVVVSGTNGKTTTTKMVVALLESQGLRVFTNRTGSNFTRGVAAALLEAVDTHGVLPADIAVLELDEAHAVHFVKQVAPRYCLLLNVLRDQLDRFGEIDYTAQLLHTIAMRTTNGIVLNGDDPRLTRQEFTADLTAPISRYGVDPSLAHLFPSDDTMRSTPGQATATTDADVTLCHLSDQAATFRFDDSDHPVSLKLKGSYTAQNAAGALTLVRTILQDKLDTPAMLAALAQVEPAFGRGEALTVNGQPCELVLVKNPSGFRLSLASFDPHKTATMIAINDQYADGRDMSWLWDVDFDTLRPTGVAMVSGVRAYDMALRLQYDEVEARRVVPGLKQALAEFVQANRGTPLRIYCTYTAMLALRRELAHYTEVNAV